MLRKITAVWTCLKLGASFERVASVSTRYTDRRAHQLRAEYLATYPGDEIPVPVESIAEDLLGLRIEVAELRECSGMLIPSARLILVNASEAVIGNTPTRRHRFTIAHELGHWICHARRTAQREPIYCRTSARGLATHAPRLPDDVSIEDPGMRLEREANIFGAELLMPEAAVREAWRASPDTSAVASRFDVSGLAAQWRLYSFGLAERPG